jgi:hypothetical protein
MEKKLQPPEYIRLKREKRLEEDKNWVRFLDSTDKLLNEMRPSIIRYL